MTTPDPHHRRRPGDDGPDTAGVGGGVAAPLTAVLVGVVVALVAQFAMDSLADGSDLGHWAQHALLFWSGIVIGLGLYALYRRARQQP
jgi:hypothetical protein